jgi:hypothetical protein
MGNTVTEYPAPVGEVFGRLTIIGKAPSHVTPKGRKEAKWVALCNCGSVVEKLAVNIRAGSTTSCGKHGHGGKKAGVAGTSYELVHHRLRKTRGPASEYLCVDCGNAAQEWSYDGCDPQQLFKPGKTRLAYSLNPDRYEPRCKRCHSEYDRQAA